MSSSQRLGPTLRDRLAWLPRPAWARATVLRRVLAAALASLGIVSMLRGDPDSAQTAVVVAEHDLRPGHVLGAGDLRTVYRATGTLPDGVLRDPGALTGRTLAAAVRGGETITDVRVLGTRLAAASTGDADARIVPIRLADAGVAELLREGDRVDVISTVDRDNGDGGEQMRIKGAAAPPRATVLAPNAIVVLVSGEQPGGRGATKERVVLLALPTRHATAVAAASLTSALTVVFH